MILTRIKKKSPVLKNGVYKGSIFSIREVPRFIIITFKTIQGNYEVKLPITAETVLKLCQIAYMGGIKEKEDFVLSSLINLRYKITVSGGKITKLQPA